MSKNSSLDILANKVLKGPKAIHPSLFFCVHMHTFCLCNANIYFLLPSHLSHSINIGVNIVASCCTNAASPKMTKGLKAFRDPAKDAGGCKEGDKILKVKKGHYNLVTFLAPNII